MSKKSRFSITVKKQTLAEQVAIAVSEAILTGEWQAGEPLPTEPELSAEFGVSRAVIRDATRMLVARGLVEAQHGRGVFVTESQAAAFGDALLLALRRSDATVWDVEQFEQMVFPEVCALAAVEASEAELVQIKELASQYIEIFARTTESYWSKNQSAPPSEVDANRAAFVAIIQAIFEATHNAVWQLLAGPVLQLRSTRDWETEGITSAELIASETRFLQTLVTAISSGDPELARNTTAKLMQLPTEAIVAMRETPVGEIPHIRVSLG
jgi:GntR family transcriptional repressor for pyruvate dehydrogenase complex